MEITSTEKVENKIARNGYLYEFEKMLANNVQCFECRRKGNQCKAMIKLDTDDDITGEVNLHTHAPSHTQVEVENIKRRYRQQQIHRNKSLELNSGIRHIMLLRISHRHQR